MIPSSIRSQWQAELQQLRDSGLYKYEWPIISSQAAEIQLESGTALNFCANNYLGLANDPRLVAAAKEGLDKYGFGVASVRFICGTQDVHIALEQRIAQFLKTEAAITFTGCWTANTGIFQALLTEGDAIVSANLNHASIIDGVRLSKAARYFYEHDNMADLDAKLAEARAAGAKKILVVTDGVFSMDGDIAPLGAVCDTAEKYEAMIMVDDSHAVGCVGATGRGSIEMQGVMGRVDIITGTFGKALGGSAGGYVASTQEVIEKLKNQARPYLFANNMLPSTAYATLKVFDIVEESPALLQKLRENTARFRSLMVDAGFDIRGGKEGAHPITPVMIGDAKVASAVAKDMIEKEHVYVIGFSYPVVPMGTARIRVQLSAAHTIDHIDRAVEAFKRVGAVHRLI